MARANKKLFFAGALVGAIVAPIALFSAGWIVTSGAANATAEEAAQLAVLERLTPICVSQFPRDASRHDQLSKLKSLSQWDRPDFVAQNGWATMPGGSSADDLVARDCAERLAGLEK